MLKHICKLFSVSKHQSDPLASFKENHPGLPKIIPAKYNRNKLSVAAQWCSWLRIFHEKMPVQLQEKMFQMTDKALYHPEYQENGPTHLDFIMELSQETDLCPCLAVAFANLPVDRGQCRRVHDKVRLGPGEQPESEEYGRRVYRYLWYFLRSWQGAQLWPGSSEQKVILARLKEWAELRESEKSLPEQLRPRH